MRNNIAVTVIITAHSRKNFLLQAINSVISMRLHIDNYQIIVVKNFYDSEIDTFISNHGILNLYCTDLNLGSKIEYSLKFIKGEIVFFLDDDDIFSQDKVETIARYFLSDTDIFYIHNGQNIIDENGNLLKRNKISNRQNDLKTIKIDQESEKKVYRLLLRKCLSFNLSSISIRREVLEKLKLFLPRVYLRTDLVILASSLDLNPKVIGYTDSPLTKYRIHGKNLSKFEIGSISNYNFLQDSITNLSNLKHFSKCSLINSLCDYFIMQTKIKVNLFLALDRHNTIYELSVTDLLKQVISSHKLENIVYYVLMKISAFKPSFFMFTYKVYRKISTMFNYS